MIDAADLITVLHDVPPGHGLEKNAVGNLAIFNGPGEYVGYVDLSLPEVVMLDDEDDE